MNNEIEVSVSRVKFKKKFIKIVKLIILFVLLLLFLLYLVMNLVYNNGNFSITLDKNLYFQRGIVIYDDPDYKVFRAELFAQSVDYFDNISYKWLPDNLHETDSSHNGENYVAYTFYIENTGEDISDYWSEIIIDDVIKNVDDAIRIRVYKNGSYVTYAKPDINGNPEPNTIPFINNSLVTFDHREDFSPGDIDKYTIVMWLEGSDLDCTDNLLGGEIKVHMEFNSEFIEVNEKKFEKN